MAGVLAIVLVAFVVFVYGVIRLGWDFDQMAALFFAMGLLAGIAGGLGAGGTAQAFVNGFGSMAYAAMLIGFAARDLRCAGSGTHRRYHRDDGRRPAAASAGHGVRRRHDGRSGRAAFSRAQRQRPGVLTMPLLVPISDLIGVSRQITVLAFQYGAGLTEFVTPHQRRHRRRNRGVRRDVRRLALVRRAHLPAAAGVLGDRHRGRRRHRRSSRVGALLPPGMCP
jgi:hypothetical protein